MLSAQAQWIIDSERGHHELEGQLKSEAKTSWAMQVSQSV